MVRITQSALHGGKGGTAWDTKGLRVLKIKLCSEHAINSIAFQYERDGETAWTPPWGGGDGGYPTEVDLKEDEFVTAIHGHYGKFDGTIVIRSLTFVTNLCEHGPYGHEGGLHFCLPPGNTNAKVVGFHGRSSNYLDAIGVHMIKWEKAMKLKAWGGGGGSEWTLNAYTRLTKIAFRNGDAIDAIAFHYELDGKTRLTPWFGGNGGGYTEINLREGEFLASIRGHVGEFQPGTVIRSLTLVTNIRACGPFGHEQGTPFSLSTTNAKIVGFHGRSGAYLDAIGVYLEQGRTIKVNPWGGPGGLPWDAEGSSCISKIRLYSGHAVDAISFQHERNGRSAWTPVWGAITGSPKKIDLQEGECLTSMHGYYGNFGNIVIRSLTFITNITQYGPYGKEEGTSFALPLTGGITNIVGFHGRSGHYLDAFGVHLKRTETFEVKCWGGDGGVPWGLFVYTRLLKIKLRSGTAIHAITFEYENNGIPTWTHWFGGEGGVLSEIMLEEEEFLTSIHGHVGSRGPNPVIRSLTFVSNLRNYGPYGPEDGTPFSYPSESSSSAYQTNTTILGFHGRGYDVLDAIGVYVKREEFSKAGPWGGTGGSEWVLKNFTRLSKIRLHSGQAINAIAFEYELNGTPTRTPNWEDGSGSLAEVSLQEGEFLTSVHGHYGDYSYIAIRSLTFVTNLRACIGPYGHESGIPFSIPSGNTEIVGFHGRSSKYYIDAIGVYLKEDETITLAPWGENRGSKWDTDGCTRLLKIKLHSEHAINAIAFQYECNKTTKWSLMWGGNGGNPYEINLQEGEFLNAIFGHYDTFQDGIVIRSLTFASNIHKYGPYGLEIGTPFSLALTNAKIIGFHGYAGKFLAAIGVYLKQEETIKVTPWGGTGSSTWDMDGCSRLLRIKLRYDQNVIYSISVQYERNGTTLWTPIRGIIRGKLTEINFGISEFLTAMHGHYGEVQGNSVIRSLTFVSNIGTYGPFGDKLGTPFSLSLDTLNSTISGFHGRSGAFLHAIGLHLKPSETIKEPPWGGTGGSEWDSQGFRHLLKIKLRAGRAIDSIAFQYEHNGMVAWTPVWGGKGGDLTEKINLGVGEFLTAIYGHYGEFRGDIVVTSLGFITNSGTYGPYGDEIGTPFTLSLGNNKIVGFHGRHSTLLNALGIYMRPN